MVGTTQLNLRFKSLQVHPLARDAFEFYSAAPRRLLRSQLSTDLNRLVKSKSIIALEAASTDQTVSVIGGFEALSLIGELKVQGRMVRSVTVTWVAASITDIRAYVDDELLALLDRMPSGQSNSSFRDCIDLMSPAARRLVFPNCGVSAGSLGKVLGLPPGKLARHKRRSMARSGILDAILASP